ncbi:MAG: hypothetical protein FWD36_10620 [Treponema sp.]|nr:hypothetical protein [Treponema sp.]
MDGEQLTGLRLNDAEAVPEDELEKLSSRRYPIKNGDNVIILRVILKKAGN